MLIPPGYYFTNLSCAVQFIRTMDAKSLRLSEDDFDAYTEGRRVAPTKHSIANPVSLITQTMKTQTHYQTVRLRLSNPSMLP